MRPRLFVVQGVRLSRVHPWRLGGTTPRYHRVWRGIRRGGAIGVAPDFSGVSSYTSEAGIGSTGASLLSSFQPTAHRICHGEALLCPDWSADSPSSPRLRVFARHTYQA